jgi:hypothetical protein
MQRERVNFEGIPGQKHGAFVEEAKKLMQGGDDEDAAKQDAPAAGGGVKIVRKLGPQKKAGPSSTAAGGA